ncbi:hypothetical protein [Mycobacterium leprae]|uniref:Uncharacterized protein MLCB1886.08c n=1 Tax=Mycobacterium leprae TaxID=1769 RepID=Q9ZBE2_MYCLR|nr:hypothetical protein [Mycobacterium leprae]CAA22905.1 hypothetical protein MLCB1886.08c [Mycobacterium leprae]
MAIEPCWEKDHLAVGVFEDETQFTILPRQQDKSATVTASLDTKYITAEFVPVRKHERHHAGHGDASMHQRRCWLAETSVVKPPVAVDQHHLTRRVLRDLV